MLCVSISYAVSSCTSRSVSYSERNSEMHTHTNVVFSGSLNCVFTSVIASRMLSSFANMSSVWSA